MRFGASIIAVLLLFAVAVEKRLFHTPTVDARQYHEKIRQAAAMAPMHVGSWLGSDAPSSPAVQRLLKPNVMVSRRYKDVQSGEQVDMILVHCADARDILGHYPPVCYKSQGWTQVSAQSEDRDIDDLLVPVTQYRFAHSGVERRNEVVVDNFMILPDGTFCRDMHEVDRSARNYRTKFFGAAQLQLVYDAAMPSEQRNVLFEQLVLANREIIDELRSGVRLNGN